HQPLASGRSHDWLRCPAFEYSQPKSYLWAEQILFFLRTRRMKQKIHRPKLLRLQLYSLAFFCTLGPMPWEPPQRRSFSPRCTVSRDRLASLQLDLPESYL